MEDKEKYYLKLLASSSVSIFLAVIISKAFSYGYKIFIARFFGVETYGLFSLAIIILGFFMAFASLGLHDGLTRYIAYYRGKKERKKIKTITSFSIKVLIFTGIVSSASPIKEITPEKFPTVVPFI